MILITNMLLTKQDYGTVAAVEVPAGRLAATATLLEEAGRGDLVPLLSAGENGCVLVTAGGTGWRFGGL